MRGDLPDIRTPCPLGATLPVIYLDDGEAQRLCGVFDRMLAPVFLALDSLPAYLDPSTAPADTLDWLAGWIGLVLEGHESAERKRELIRAGAEAAQWRGTVRGIRDAVVAAFGVIPEIVEAGGVAVSTEPSGLIEPTEPSGSTEPWGSTEQAESAVPPASTQDTSDAASVDLTVIVRARNSGAVDLDRLGAVVARVKPIHLSHRVVVADG